MFNRLTNRAEFNRMLHLELIILSKGDLFKEQIQRLPMNSCWTYLEPKSEVEELMEYLHQEGCSEILMIIEMEHQNKMNSLKC